MYAESNHPHNSFSNFENDMRLLELHHSESWQSSSRIRPQSCMFPWTLEPIHYVSPMFTWARDEVRVCC